MNSSLLTAGIHVTGSDASGRVAIGPLSIELAPPHCELALFNFKVVESTLVGGCAAVMDATGLGVGYSEAWGRINSTTVRPCTIQWNLR